ncbi:MAG: hypothetical protein JW765_00290, partial [Deltaproteobacteria bacterium]|nr:hypothetical protein [Candidatus Zymogenaceae bacterium]
MTTQKFFIAITLALSSLALAGCNSNIFKKYMDNRNDKGIYIPSGVLTPDDSAPDIATVTATTHTNVRVVFQDKSMALDAASAINFGNYTIQGVPNVQVLAANLESDNLTVNLTVDGTDPDDMVHNAAYTLVVLNVADKYGNAIYPQKTSVFLGRGPVVAEFSGTPANPTNVTSIDIDVGGTDVVAYKYSLDGGLYSDEIDVGDNITAAGLAEGVHSLEAVGKDSLGNWQTFPEASTFDWQVDLTPPAATYSGQPNNPTNDQSVDMTVGGAQVVAYKYKIDAEAWSGETAVSEHIERSAITEGPHMIYIIGRDAAGNWQAEGDATAYAWSIDITPPTAVLSGTPANPTNNQGTNITVGGTDVVTYRYKIDGGGYGGDISIVTPIALSGLAEGPHTISVIAKD